MYTYTTQFRPGDGSPPGSPLVESTTTELRLVCVEDVNGRAYVVQRGTHKSGSRMFWSLFHQDRTGLYQESSRVAPACDASPLARASEIDHEFRAVDAVDWGHKIDGIRETRARDAIRLASPILESRLERLAAAMVFGGAAPSRHSPGGDPLENEATVLRYPLHPGVSWNVRPAAAAWPLVAVVEGQDVLRLPTGRTTAYRIRYTDKTPGSANGDVHMWYGRSGYLGAVGHSSYTIPGLGGAPPDTVVADWSDALDDISLVAPPDRRGD